MLLTTLTLALFLSKAIPSALRLLLCWVGHGNWKNFLRSPKLEMLGIVRAKVGKERDVNSTRGSEILWEWTGMFKGNIIGFRKNLFYGTYILFHKKLVMFVHTLSSRSSDGSHGNLLRLVHKGL